MTVHVDGRAFKQFHAKDPITKSIQAKARSCATAAFGRGLGQPDWPSDQ